MAAPECAVDDDALSTFPQAVAPAAGSDDAAGRAAIDTSVQRWALANHLRSTRIVIIASSALAALLLAGLHPRVAPLPMLAWLLALAAVLLARLALTRPRPQLQPTVDLRRRLLHYRLAALAHGAVWGASVALLPPGAGPEAMSMLGSVLGGLTLGSLALMLFDRHAAMCFVLPMLLPLALRVALPPNPLLHQALPAGAVVLMLLAVFVLAARRLEAERRALALSSLAQAAEGNASATRNATALADQQRMMALLLERTGQGFWFVDNDFRTTDANPAMCRLLGLPREALLGRSIFDFVDAENAELLRGQTRQRAQNQTGSYQLTLTRPDGTQVVCWNNATPLHDAAGRQIGSVGMLSDLTAQQAIEREVVRTGELLAQKTQVLESTLESLAQGVLSVDAEGRINAYNRRCVELLGLPEALLAGRPTLLALTRYQRDQGEFGPALEALDTTDREDLQRCLQGDTRSLAQRYQRRRPNGTVLDVRTHFTAGGGLVRTYTDVTANVMAEQALRDSESRFRRLADAAPALIWLSDRDGAPIWFNQRWLDHTGRTLEQECAFSWTERLHPEDYERCRTGHALALAAQGRYELEFRLLPGTRGNGLTIWIADSGIPRFSADGHFEGYISYGWDITARKAAEAAILQARDRAEQADRAKSEFLSRMSHELRTPLNAILGFGQLLASDAEHPLDPLQESRVQELLRGGRHLLSLINEVLDLSRIEAGTLQLQLQPVSLPALLQDCLRLVQPMAEERDIRLSLQAPADAAAAAVASADPKRLEQVLLNLLSNAIKYHHAGGQVRLHLVDEATRVRIEVHDDGPGIAVDLQPRLFQAFDRLGAERTATEGTGIGLVLSKWLVELMGGEIGFDSRPGAGSCFWVRLRAGDAGQASPAAALPAPQAAPVRRVLYIEDNEVNQMVMEGMLGQRPQLRLQMATLPEDGLAMASADPPDLILLDIQLPGIDGFEVLRRLRAAPATARVPVVAVSANAMPLDFEHARQAGFAGYVTKPLELAMLLETVDRQLAGAAAG